MLASRSRRNASVSLVMTFLLGMAVGFSLCYAFFEVAGRTGPDSAPTQEEAPAASQGTTEFEPEPEIPHVMASSDTGNAVQDASALSLSEVEEGEPVTEDGAELSATEQPVQLTPEEAGALWPGRHLFLGMEAGLIEEEVTDMLARRRPGGVYVLSAPGTGPEIVAATIRQVRDAAGMGNSPADLPLAMVAGENGFLPRSGMDIMPTPEELGRGADPAALHAAAEIYATAARNAGAALLLAPRLDVWRDGAPAPRAQYFGATPDLTAQAGLAFARGLRDSGIVPLVNTYPGMSGAAPQPGGVPVIRENDVERLAELMLPFAEAADAQVPAILAGNAAVPVLDRARPDRPACASPVLIREILREKWGYSGVVIADVRDLGHFTAASLPRHVVDCLAAGCDAVLLGPVAPETVDDLCEAIVAALQIGKIPPQQYGQSRARLETMRNLVGRFAQPVLPGAAPPQTPPEAAETGSQPLPEEAPQESVPEPPQPVLPEEAAPSPTPEGVAVHVIEKGETLSGIAAKYGVTAAELMSLNKLRDGNIKFGNKLKIPVKETQTATEEMTAEEPSVADESPVVESGEKAAGAVEALEGSGETAADSPAPPEDAEPIPTPAAEAEVIAAPEEEEPDASPAETVDAAQEDTPVEEAPVQEDAVDGDAQKATEDPALDSGGAEPEPEQEPEPEPEEEPAVEPLPEPVEPIVDAVEEAAVEYVFHTVQPGDTMYRISARHGVSQKAIMELNGITDANLVKLGSTLKIPQRR